MREAEIVHVSRFYCLFSSGFRISGVLLPSELVNHWAGESQISENSSTWGTLEFDVFRQSFQGRNDSPTHDFCRRFHQTLERQTIFISNFPLEIPLRRWHLDHGAEIQKKLKKVDMREAEIVHVSRFYCLLSLSSRVSQMNRVVWVSVPFFFKATSCFSSLSTVWFTKKQHLSSLGSFFRRRFYEVDERRQILVFNFVI